MVAIRFGYNQSFPRSTDVGYNRRGVRSGGTSKARCAYAWMMYREGKEDRTLVILGLPPVTSAQDAVKVAMGTPAKR